MELELRFFATFREAAGGKTVSREFEDGATVGDVLAALEADYEGLEGQLLDGGEIREHLSVLRNGREVVHLDGVDTGLEDGDELSVFPPVAGGRGGRRADCGASPGAYPPRSDRGPGGRGGRHGDFGSGGRERRHGDRGPGGRGGRHGDFGSGG